jgi:hypothetical protein
MSSGKSLIGALIHDLNDRSWRQIWASSVERRRRRIFNFKMDCLRSVASLKPLCDIDAVDERGFSDESVLTEVGFPARRHEKSASATDAVNFAGYSHEPRDARYRSRVLRQGRVL